MATRIGAYLPLASRRALRTFCATPALLFDTVAVSVAISVSAAVSVAVGLAVAGAVQHDAAQRGPHLLEEFDGPPHRVARRDPGLGDQEQGVSAATHEQRV